MDGKDSLRITLSRNRKTACGCLEFEAGRIFNSGSNIRLQLLVVIAKGGGLDGLFPTLLQPGEQFFSMVLEAVLHLEHRFHCLQRGTLFDKGSVRNLP